MYQVRIVQNVPNKQSGTTVKSQKNLGESHFDDLKMSYHS